MVTYFPTAYVRFYQPYKTHPFSIFNGPKRAWSAMPTNAANMPTLPKRRRNESPPKAERQSKAPRLETARTRLSSLPTDSFRIEINLRSQSKAERNDPKPQGYWRNHWAKVAEHLSAGQADAAHANTIESSTDENLRPNISNESVEPIPIHGLTALEQVNVQESDELIALRPSSSRPKTINPLGVTNEEGSDEQDSSESDFDENFEEDRSACGSEDDEFAHFKWLEQMDGEVNWTPADSSETKTIGSCNGKLIRRDEIQHIFYDEMEEPTTETSTLAFNLFDRYGRLRTEFKTHPIKKGSGIWQNELDKGDLLFIEYLHVQSLYRHRGLGSKVFTDMFEKARKKTDRHFFALVQPGYLVRESEAEMGNLTGKEREAFLRQAEDIAHQFWRSLGFRRIGSSFWFGLASDPNHSCHGLLATDDYDPPSQPTHKPHPDIEALRSTIFASGDDECVEQLKQKLQDAAGGDPRWQATDERGNTLLHSAAINCKPKSVEWILQRDFGSTLLDIRNDEGETPLEALQFHLEAVRIRHGWSSFCRIEPTSDKFKGFDEAAVACLALLKCTGRLSDIERLRLTYGCTCGSCIGGFLSPRMSLALLCQAEVNQDMLYQSFCYDSGPVFIAFNEDQLQFLQPSVRTNLSTNKSMREGFVKFFDHFATCIRNKELPTEPFIMRAMENNSEWPPVSRAFLQRGGTVYSVASMIFKNAMEEDNWAGDGNHWDIFKDDIRKLPACRNDHEFGFVSGMCGFERVSYM